MHNHRRVEAALDLLGPPQAPAADEATDGVTRMLRAIRAHLGMDVAFVSRVTEDAVTIRHADMVPNGPFEVGACFAPEDSYCQRVIDGRLPNLLPNTSQAPEAAALECTHQIPVGAHLSVPIHLSDGSVYGTFCCFSFAPDTSLNQRDLQMLRAFAALAADEIEAREAAARRVKEIQSNIERVIERDGLISVFQPIYRIADRTIVGVECLARFPDCEARPPSDWFREAHEVGLGVDLELAAVETSLRALPFIPRDMYVSINISPAAALDPRFRNLVETAGAERLVVEITEHAVVHDYVLLARALEPLRGRCRFAVDDAGAGYSSLRHILDLAPDIIKLDMSLIRGIDGDRSRRTLAGALVAFAAGMNSQIVAEGVETGSELATLKELGVETAQGYYLSRPLPVMALRHLIAASPGAGETPELPRPELAYPRGPQHSPG